MYRLYFKKIFEILTNKDKKNFILALFLLINKSLLEVLSIGLLIPILNFLVNEESKNILYKKLPFLSGYNNNELITFFVAIFLVIYFLKTLFFLFYNRWNARFINNLNVNIVQRLLEKYLHKNYNFFLEINSATLLRNLTAETSLFSSGIVGQVILAITHTVFIISICIFLIIYNFYSLYVILILLFLSYLVIKFSNEKFKKWGDIRQKENAYFIKKLNEVIGSIKEIILYQKKQFFLNEVYKHSKNFSDANIYRDTSLSIIAPVIEFLGIFIFFSFFIFLVLFSSIGMGKIIVLFGVFAFASIKLLPAVIGLVRAIQTIKFNLPAIKVLEELSNKKITEKKEIFEKVPSEIFNIEEIKFNDVNFKYNSQNKTVLNNVNFEIKKGDRIGLIGETGSGKTTLLNLISTLIHPDSGSIEINGKNNELLIQNLRSSIGYVSQSVYLADNTVFFNISLSNNFNENDRRKMIKILDSLNLRILNDQPIEDILSIGERGSKLSGGQAQRIGIARAIFRDPEILILDESTSALDLENEKVVLNYLFNELKNKIIIFCTHKKDILKFCNKVLEVSNGNVFIRGN